ncbi:hypothetical protein [Actinomadura rugatobispora]|uniref:Uncharacterized protein n=1 Tax=Actinomadura rugatobispora TaxID=1994 RepID=A0ABW0ZUG8_9ACTN|nr:hypothetical protein GCM10010200_096660 [Actinomadura rugatobispora]
MRSTLSATAFVLAAILLSGCGDDGDGKAGASAQSPAGNAQATQPVTAEPKGGLAGTWKPINKSPIATLTITGDTVRTTGQLACPGTVTGADTAEPVLTLKCTTENAERKRGTLKLKPDGSALVISWDGPAWGGMIDSLKRAG